MTKDEVLAKVTADGPIAMQDIDHNEYNDYADVSASNAIIDEHLKTLKDEGLVKCIPATSGNEDKWGLT